MQKMIVTDLDGTLLNTDKKITERTRKALEACHEKGMRIAFATARPLRAVKPYVQEVPCDGVVYHNGSSVLVNQDSLAKNHRIPAARVRTLMKRLTAAFPGKKLSVEMNDALYANFDVSYYWSYTDGVTTDFTNLPDGEADKIVAELDDSNDFNRIQEALSAQEYAQICEGALCLIMNRQATKLNGVNMLCQHWSIPLQEVIAFGDDYNDLEMIVACGTGVAMGNAIEPVKEAADFVTRSNDQDGVADFLKREGLC